jgi:UPF0716 family protein affecting phage T7 exclusion
MTNDPPDVAESSVQPKPPRFGLRSLFGFVSLICVTLAVFVGVGPLLGAALLLMGLVILVHAAAACLGHRLLHSATRRRHKHSDAPR